MSPQPVTVTPAGPPPVTTPLKPVAERPLPERIKAWNKLLRKDPDAFAKALPSDNSNRDLLLGLIPLHPQVVRDAAPELKDDLTFGRQAVFANCRAVKYLSPRLQDDDVVAGQIARWFAEPLRFLSPRFKDNDALVRDAIFNFPNALHAATPRLQQNPDFVRDALDAATGVDQFTFKSPHALEDARRHYTTQQQRDFILKTFQGDGRALDAAEPSLRFAPPFVAQCARLNPVLLTRPQTWKLLQEGHQRGEISEQDWAGLQQLRAQQKAEWKKLDIDFPYRFLKTDSLLEIQHNRAEQISGKRTRRDGSPDNRPLAVLIYPKSDHNGVFELENLDKLTRQYRVVYYEAGSVAALMAAAREGTAGGRDRALLMVLAGHGTKHALLLDEAKHQTLNVFDEKALAGLGDFIWPNGDIVVAACKAGKGGVRAWNAANTVANAANTTTNPNVVTPSVDVTAPRKNAQLGFQLSPSGLLQGVDHHILGETWIDRILPWRKNELGYDPGYFRPGGPAPTTHFEIAKTVALGMFQQLRGKTPLPDHSPQTRKHFDQFEANFDAAEKQKTTRLKLPSLGYVAKQFVGLVSREDMLQRFPEDQAALIRTEDAAAAKALEAFGPWQQALARAQLARRWLAQQSGQTPFAKEISAEIQGRMAQGMDRGQAYQTLQAYLQLVRQQIIVGGKGQPNPNGSPSPEMAQCQQLLEATAQAQAIEVDHPESGFILQELHRRAATSPGRDIPSLLNEMIADLDAQATELGLPEKAFEEAQAARRAVVTTDAIRKLNLSTY